jgi:hypothetical protein
MSFRAQGISDLKKCLSALPDDQYKMNYLQRRIGKGGGGGGGVPPEAQDLAHVAVGGRAGTYSLKLPMLIVTGEGLCSILTHLGCP